ncbi:CS domain-containing protein [Paenibacillus sp. NPDC056579]|uniref:CS domain-containing protein n=1 Tax=Paenibacillus sp. NPDC056579 TaxID=3345871 RepID=UPI003674F4D2
MNDNRNPFSGVDWEQFQKYFAGTTPFPLHDHKDSTTWVEKYVQSILKQTVPEGTAARQYDTELVETHQAIIMKIHIPDVNQAKNMRIHVASNQVKLEGAEGQHLQLIRLSHPVVPSDCKAVYKAGIMQLHMRKQDRDEHFYEIDVKFV